MAISILSPGVPLRFVERDGKRILQQIWIRGYWLSGEFTNSSEHEWRDVPLMDEATPTDAAYWSEATYT